MIEYSFLVSVIIPVYKVEKELNKCIDSVINQTYSNLEIILVDDGSPDNCPAICDKYAEKDHRIIVIHKKNGGLSDARNTGLEICKGDYISFVDSDDWIDDDFIETLLTNAIKENADISIVACNLVWDYGRCKTTTDDNGYYVFNQDDGIKELLIQQKYQCMVCQKLYKREVIAEVRFPVGKLYEDVAISLPTFLNAKKIVTSGIAKYNYYQRKESIVNSQFSDKKLFFLDCCKEIIAYSDSHENKYDLEAHTFYLRGLLFFLLQMNIESKKLEERKELSKKIKDEIKNNFRYVLGNPYLENRKKLLLTLICFGFPIKLLAKAWEIYMR